MPLVTAIVLQFAAPVLAACPEPVGTVSLAAQLASAESRFASMEGAAFSGEMDQASFLVPCLSSVITPDLAARYHLLQGLHLFMTRNEEGALRAFSAERATTPGLELPLYLVPEGHAIRELWATADGRGPTLRVAEPVDGHLAFDGTAGDRRPQDRPAFVQVVTGDGSVASTAWLEPGEPMPLYEAVPLKSEPAPTTALRLPRVPLLVGAGAAGLLGGVLYGVAASRAASFEGPHPPSRTLADLRASQRATNTLVVSSIVAGSLSASTVGVAVVAGRR
jgi:hypothetical protein